VNGLAQGSAGAALVMSFALLRTRRIDTASILLAVQSGAVALAAVLVDRPEMAVPPLLLAGGVWLLRDRAAVTSSPAEITRFTLLSGALLAVLCQSQGVLALPLALVLLAILLSATRPPPLMQVMALVALQNGLVLAVCFDTAPASIPSTLLPVAYLALPLPLAACLVIARIEGTDERKRSWPAWTDLAISIAMFAATLIVPLDALASVFAPLLGFDGMVRAIARRKRQSLSSARRAFALLQNGSVLLAVCAPNLIVAWLAIVAAMAAFVLPRLRAGIHQLTGESPRSLQVIAVSSNRTPDLTIPGRLASAMIGSARRAASPTRRWDGAVLAFLGAGMALFGLLILPSGPSVPGLFAVFAGFVSIAAVVPDLAVVLTILLLRLSNQTPWPPNVEALGITLALIALLVCSVRLLDPNRPDRATGLVLGQCSIAVLALCLGEADGRFAALVLLILLVLTRCAARMTGGFASTLAMAGLGGLPPVGVFPGLVLVVMAICGYAPWLLLPLGVALIPMFLAGLPRHPIVFPLKATIPSVAWLPLAVAVLIGYCAPEGLVHWWHMLTAVRS
jgi:hypothetical protein